MVPNYIKEQIALGQIEARKIYGKLNNADMHTPSPFDPPTSQRWPTGSLASRPRNSLPLLLLYLLYQRNISP